MGNRIQLAAIRGHVTETERKTPTAVIMSVCPSSACIGATSYRRTETCGIQCAEFCLKFVDGGIL